jgi:hypothetical protein
MLTSKYQAFGWYLRANHGHETNHLYVYVNSP